MLFYHLILCCPFLLLPSIFSSKISTWIQVSLKTALLIPVSIVWIHTALFFNALLSSPPSPFFGCSGSLLLHEAFLFFRPEVSGVWASAVVVLRLSCPTACAIFPDQGSNPCPLPWQVDSYPLDHQGSSSHPFSFLPFPPVNSKTISGSLYTDWRWPLVVSVYLAVGLTHKNVFIFQNSFQKMTGPGTVLGSEDSSGEEWKGPCSYRADVRESGRK